MSVTFTAKRNPTLRDFAQGKVDGKFDREIVELVLESNPIMGHFVVLPANDGKNDTTTIRTGLPTATWTAFYEGVQPSKGEKKQVTNSAGHLSSLLQVDALLINSQEDAETELGDEAFAKGEAMTQEVCDTAIYGSTKINGKKFNGLAPIYSEYEKNGATKDEANFYCVQCKRSSSPDNSALRSIWLIGHGRMGTALFYPKGTTAGLKRGEVMDNVTTDSNGGRLRVKEQFFDWDVGLRCKDFRKNFRICNIESNNLNALDVDLGEYMLQALCRTNKTGVQQKFYMPQSVYEYLCIKTRKLKLNNGFFDFRDFEGELILHFQGVPIFVLDALETNESAVAQAS
jgi:hypothetical protein